MTAAETVAHLHAAMLWDFRVVMVVNLVLWGALLAVLLRDRR
jgi:hypothetical protein